MNAYFSTDDSLFQITDRYPETIKVFLKYGFTQLADEEKRSTFGKALKLDIALMMRQLDMIAFEKELVASIEVAGESKINTDDVNTVRVKGLLPCPVRLPLQEQLDAFVADSEKDGLRVEASLRAASMGLEWISNEVEAATSAEKLDDIYLTAGFDMFFEDRYFRRFTKDGSFINPIEWSAINTQFQNESIDLLDPEGKHGIVAVVPAVFLVNTKELGNRPVPKSWKEICDPMYERSISLPVSDFDLFNAILLTMDQRYGRWSVEALGRNMLQSLHPAQMVKSEKTKQEKPAITIMPNFFTKMVREGSSMVAVWPEDGAIISPVFLIGKKSKGENMRKVARLFSSKTVAEILSHQGLFPSLHPEVDNKLAKENKFMWLGWDYILNHNLNQEFAACEAAFNSNHLSQ